MKVYQFVFGEPSTFVKGLIRHNKKVLKQNKIPYKIIKEVPKKYISFSDDLKKVADLARLDYAESNPQSLYIDWDIEINNIKEFEIDVPLFFPRGASCRPSVCAFYTGGESYKIFFSAMRDKALSLESNTAEKALRYVTHKMRMPYGLLDPRTMLHYNESKRNGT